MLVVTVASYPREKFFSRISLAQFWYSVHFKRCLKQARLTGKRKKDNMVLKKWHARIHRWLRNKYNLHYVIRVLYEIPTREREEERSAVESSECHAWVTKLQVVGLYLLNNRSSPLQSLAMLSVDRVLPGKMRLGFLPCVNTLQDHTVQRVAFTECVELVYVLLA